MKRFPRSSGSGAAGALAVLVLFIAGCSGSGSPTEPQSAAVGDVEAQSFGLLNQARAQGGVGTLSLDARVAEVARRHSEAMRDQGFFGHAGSSGEGLRARLRGAGIPFSAAGENLARVNGSPDPAGVAHQMLMNSEEHRENIMEPVFSRAGVGVARSGSSYWVTQIFIDP